MARSRLNTVDAYTTVMMRLTVIGSTTRRPVVNLALILKVIQRVMMHVKDWDVGGGLGEGFEGIVSIQRHTEL